MSFNIDSALLVARTLKTTKIADPNWVMKNPLWFMALRTEDILDIHNIVWKNRKSKTFAKYAKLLASIELDICKRRRNSKVDKIICGNSDARLKYYQYMLAIMFVPGLRTIDTEQHGLHVWNHKYFAGKGFADLFNSINTKEVKRHISLIPTTKSVIPNLIKKDIKLLITDKAVTSGKASNPIKFVYNKGWSTADRLTSKYHYNND